MYDVIIIGKGPAGISAALYTVRGSLKTLVLGNGLGALGNAEKIDNYYGFSGGISGKELVENGVEQAKNLGCEVLSEEALSITKNEHFLVKTTGGNYEAKQILIAAGKPRNRSHVEGLEALLGRGVSMCAVCDGFFYRGKRLAVLGNANYALAETEELLRFTKEITLCTNGREPVWDGAVPEGVAIDTRPLARIEGEQRVERLLFADSSTLSVDGIFVAEGTASALDFAVKMGILTEGGNIVVDAAFATNVDGVFAAGDCIGGFLQVAKAVSDGALAARSIIKRTPKR